MTAALTSSPLALDRPAAGIVDQDWVRLPDREGAWRMDYTDSAKDRNHQSVYFPASMELDVYPLDPVGGVLCVWSGDVGWPLSTSDFWETDEWLGHIPITLFAGNYHGARFTQLPNKD